MTPIGVAFTGHWLAVSSVRNLARRADALGFSVILVDGDVGTIASRPKAPVHFSSTLTSVALEATSSARVGAIRLPVFWNAGLLARDLMTLQNASDGRALGLLGVGNRRHQRALGLPARSVGERIAALEETLDVVRRLLAGEAVTHAGRFVEVEELGLPSPARPIPLIVAAAKPRALALAERYADILDANVPPLAARIEEVRAHLTRPIPLWVWVFARPGRSFEDAAAEYRRHCPWFSDLDEAEVRQALLWGEPERCRDRLAEMAADLDVDMPVLDLTGLDESASQQALEIFAPAERAEFS